MTKDIKAVEEIIKRWQWQIDLQKNNESHYKLYKKTIDEQQVEVDALKHLVHFEAQHKKPFICHCGQEGAMTVKVLNDDFFQCPRCGGLFVREYIPKKDLQCYSCGEPIKYDDDSPECYCHGCLPNDVIYKKDLQGVLDVYEKYKGQEYLYNLIDKDMWQAIKKLAERGE